jgi:hypothetical protein
MKLNKQTLLSGNYCIQVDTQEQWEKLCKWIGAPANFPTRHDKKYLYIHFGKNFQYSDENVVEHEKLIYYSAIDFSEQQPERKITHYVCPKDIPEWFTQQGDEIIPAPQGYKNKRSGQVFSETLVHAFFTPVYEPLKFTFPGGTVTIEGTVTEEELKTIKM